MSKNKTYSWQLCFLKKHPQFFHSWSSARIMGFPTTGPAVKKHISPQMAKESIAMKRTTCHSLSLVCRRVPLLHLHLLLQHLHRRILWSARKNPATERSETMSKESRWNPSRGSAETENTQIKMKTTKNHEVNYCKKCRNGYRISRRIWWIRMFNRINTLPALLMNYPRSRKQKWYRVRVSIASLYSLPERPKLWHLLGDENYKGFLQKTYWYSRAQSGTFWWFNNRGSQSSQWYWRKERYCELANKTTQQLHHVLTTTNSKKKKWDLLENCRKFAHRLFWNVYTWLVIGRLDTLWSANLPVQSQNGRKLVTNV